MEQHRTTKELNDVVVIFMLSVAHSLIVVQAKYLSGRRQSTTMCLLGIYQSTIRKSSINRRSYRQIASYHTFGGGNGNQIFTQSGGDRNRKKPSTICEVKNACHKRSITWCNCCDMYLVLIPSSFVKNGKYCRE